jgi:SAM-dependent methyltransferase
VSVDDAASFRTSADAYSLHVGRYGQSLAEAFVALSGIVPEWRVLDVGCGPGALTAVLAERVGAGNVAAVDPSEPWASACAARVPDADIRIASAERLPHANGHFDAVLSQLAVNFLTDAPAGVREMVRVTRPGGVVSACVWDYAGDMTMLRAFWDAAVEVDPRGATVLDEGRRMPYCQPGELERLWWDSGLRDVQPEAITAHASYTGFDDFWSPFPQGVGPSGAYCASLDHRTRDALRDECRRRLGSPTGPFELSARAWAVTGRRG